MSDVQVFVAVVCFVMVGWGVLKMWLFFKKPEAYRRLKEYEGEWRAERDARIKKGVGAGLQVGGILWRLFKR